MKILFKMAKINRQISFQRNIQMANRHEKYSFLHITKGKQIKKTMRHLLEAEKMAYNQRDHNRMSKITKKFS